MTGIATEQIVTWLAPPLLGAFIGYLTNSIAIRMLFRPLRPWHVLGLRVPLTPGIIPARRGELAERMGETVGRHLLTADDVARVLGQEGFRRTLRRAVQEKLSDFAGRELGPLESLVPVEFRSRFRDLLDQLRLKLVDLLIAYLQSDDCRDRLAAWLQRRGDELLRRDLTDWLGEEGCRDLLEHLGGRIDDFLQSERVGRAVEELVDQQIDRILDNRKSLAELLPEDLVEALLDQLEQEVPALLEKFGGLLYDPEFRERLIRKARQGIDGFLDSLQGLAGLLSGFVNLDSIYEKLPGFLDKAADEIANWLREEKTREQVATMLRERARGFLDKPVAGYLEKLPFEKVHAMRLYVRSRARRLVAADKTRAMARNLLASGFEQVRQQRFEQLADQVLPPGTLEQWRRELPDRLTAWLGSDAVRRTLDDILRRQIEERALRRPLGRLSARLPADIEEELVTGLCRILGEVLQREVPPLVEALNISRMVRDKINGLDILQVEGLLLSIMKEQFKYINLFGALLGFLIGMVNLLVL